MATLHRITVYPIKSLDGHDLSASEVLAGGALAHDRRYALVDNWGRHVNGKRHAAIHTIRANYSDDLKQVTLSSGGQVGHFAIADEQASLASWCSDLLGVNCRLVENATTGFPDDPVAPGPTVVSTASLEAVTAWFEGMELEESRRRFRFNLEVGDCPPFWEDGLVPPLQKLRHFQIGACHWQGRSVCERCVVPTRHSRDGRVTTGFARDFALRRAQTLPDWASPDRYEHFYRLGINTGLESSVQDASKPGMWLQVGDQVAILGEPSTQ